MPVRPLGYSPPALLARLLRAGRASRRDRTSSGLAFFDSGRQIFATRSLISRAPW
jgi:hypothetical protein